MDTTIGERVKIRRKQLGLSQSQLSKLCGKTIQAISMIETGRVKQPGNLPALATALNSRTDWLLAGKLPIEASNSSSGSGDQIQSSQVENEKATSVVEFLSNGQAWVTINELISKKKALEIMMILGRQD